MAYYTLDGLRFRCLSSATNSTADDILTEFGKQADAAIDRLIKSTALRSNRLSALPAVPLSSPPQDIKDAANDMGAAFYYRQQRDIEQFKSYYESAKTTIEAYIVSIKETEVTILSANV